MLFAEENSIIKKSLLFAFCFLAFSFLSLWQTACYSSAVKPKIEKVVPQPRPANQPRIMLFGDSLTYGFGLENHETESFPALLQARLDAEDYNYEVINAGNASDAFCSLRESKFSCLNSAQTILSAVRLRQRILNETCKKFFRK
jgi:hypothetical protein